MANTSHDTTEATTATVEHAAEGAHHDAFMGLDSYGWVAVAFLVFVGLLLKLKVPAAIAAGLDARGARVRAELDEAKRLRADAEALLADYKAREAQAVKDAAAIVATAKTEAEAIVANAKTQAEQAIQRRTRMAEDKIAAAERAAEADLRARAANLATAAAVKLIQSDAGIDQGKLTEQSIADLERRLH